MAPSRPNRRLLKKPIKIEDKLRNTEKKVEEKKESFDLTVETLPSEVINAFGNSADIKMIEGIISERNVKILFLESMVDSTSLKETTSKFLSSISPIGEYLKNIDELSAYCKGIFGGASYKIVSSKDESIHEIINGSVVIVVEHIDKALAVNIMNGEKRSVAEPTSQTVIRGPKDAFIESISTNVSLIRRRIRNKNLRFEQYTIGEDTQTTVYLGFFKGIANEAIIQEVRNRLKKIKVSAIFESGNIEELIADKTFTLFPLALNTERPDTVAANLMEGKMVILIDGTPFALIVPAVFVNFFESPEDYYQSFFLGSFLRMIRYLSFMIALLTPSIYVGVLTYHHELLPTTLLLSVIAQREGIPFPAVVEVLVMEITFEILREAGVRMPRVVGQMVSIVGALVIGQAAAEAGIISNIMIIIVSITAIANFVSPIYSFATASRLLRFLLIFFAAILGLYGVLLVLVAMVAHLAALRSFGVPYLAPIAPFIIEDQKDVFVRFPFWNMKKRPKYIRSESEQKVFSASPPSPSSMKGGNTS
ncbi:spore germination protein [Neobacillus niacini]|uniref:spore germination protein n=1 Tax=Neobacillus niacini TaxID=86668 RepID=UPI00203AED42|nr:spore germination protein [Neobacillus niacini]MCM3690116.1 spore germination protein [Neobacillus niacini]